MAVIHRYGMGIEALQPYLATFTCPGRRNWCIYMFVWMAKFGAAYGVRTGIHVGVDVLINRMQDNTRASSSCLACAPARCSPRSSAPWAPTSCEIAQPNKTRRP